MKKKAAPILTAVIFVIIVAIVVVAGGLIKKYKPSDEKADLKSYFGIENSEQLALVVNDQIAGGKGILIDGRPYIEYEGLSGYINERFYWDHHENLLLYTLPNDVVSTQVGSKDYYVTKSKKSMGHVIVKADGNKTYVDMEYIKKYTNMSYKVYKNPGRIVVTTKWGKIKTAEVKRSSQVRVKGGVKSPILTEVEKKTSVQILDKGDKWDKVRTDDGFIGYIRNNKLSDAVEKNISQAFKEPDYTSIKKDYAVNMAWHQVSNQTANNQVLTTIANTKGLNTISPTWFSVSDNDGNISSLASTQYMNYAHQAGLEVWGLVSDFNEKVNMEEVLSYTTKRERLSNQLIAEAIQYGLDGINVDFEKISKDAASSYIQFIRELSVKCRKNGIVLSVDNYVPYSYNDHYNRKEQGVFADYVIIMGYDEHYNGSKEAGSVASIGYVEQGIKNTLKEVPADKVINAVPFYTRLWKETPKTKEELNKQQGTEDANYKNKVTSEALGMDTAKQRLKAVGVNAKWDEETGQYFAKYTKDGSVYKIWLEEEKSIAEKLKLVKKYELGGVAAWKLGYERASIWDVILKYVN